jgi:hypothetical protein
MQLTSRGLAVVALGSVLLGCCDSSKAEAVTVSTTTGRDTDDDATAGSGATSGGEAVWPPSQCVGVTDPLSSAECLEGASAACRAMNTEVACEAAEPRDFGAMALACGWVAVVPLVDAQSCALEVPSYRCEGYLSMYVPSTPFPEPYCGPEPRLDQAWSFDTHAREFVSMSGGGPVGAWLFEGGTPGEPYYTCAENIAPAAPPECDCLDAVCEAVGLGADG